MIKNLLVFALLCGSVIAAADDGVLIKSLELLDVDKPQLGEVKKLSDAGNTQAAFDEYKKILVGHIAEIKPAEKFSYWLYNTADADRLLEGVLTTTQYGKAVTTTTKIGLPGTVAWYQVPQDGYATLMRDITTMHWVTKLADKYHSTGDLRYLRAWQGYWNDFVANWPSEFEKAKRNPEIMNLVEKQSILWSDIALYIGWRLENFTYGFNLICRRAVDDGQLAAIDNHQLAALLVHLDTFEAAKGIRWIQRDGGVPNQRVHCATAMFELGVYLNTFKNSPTWRELGIMEVRRSGFLADGTDMEQSLNYNKGYVLTVRKFVEMSERLPDNEKGVWLDELKQMYKYRYYYLHSIAKPDGSQPIIGKNNTWRGYDKSEKEMPGLSGGDMRIDDFSDLPLSKTIYEYVYRKSDAAPPAFNSIYFPYGGYVVLRSGWGAESLYCFMKTSRPGNGHMREGGNGIELSAHGQNLIVNSGGEPYNPDLKQNGYWHSTISQNSISVDGYSQDLRHNQIIPVVYDKPINSRFLSGAAVDFAEGAFRGVYAGWNFKNHGTDSPEYYKIPKDVIIDDVNHDRQILFLKNEKIFIVTDIIDSEKEHLFSQGWLLAPEYKPEMISFGANCITTNRSDAVNVGFYHFGVEQIDYAKPYGTFEPNSILGWSGQVIDMNKGLFTPLVNLLAEWKGKGRQILITVIVPYKYDSPVESVKSLKTGFEMILSGGRAVSYDFNGVDMSAKLVTPDTEFILTAENGYEITSGGERSYAVVPSKFEWSDTPAGEAPSYK